MWGAGAVAMLSFKPPEVQLRLHSGTTDAGTLGWRYGPTISGLELKHLAPLSRDFFTIAAS